jgi:Predicted permeases
MQRLPFGANLRGYALAFSATLLWSGNFVVARGLANEHSPVEISFWRWGIAFLALAPFSVKTILANLPLLKKVWGHVIIMALTSISLFNTFIYKAGHTTEATNMALLAATSPIVMALLARAFLGQRLSRYQVWGICIAVCGVLILISKGSFATFAAMTFSEGDIWMMAAVLLFATYSLQLRMRPKEFPSTAFFALLVIIGFFALVPSMLFLVFTGQAAMPTATTGAALVYIGLGAGVAAFLCWNAAVEHIGMIRAGIIYYSIPFFASVEAMIFLGETMTLPQLVGGALILGGILYSVLGDILPAYSLLKNNKV